MPSKKRLNTSRKGRQRKTRYFVDRNLGSYYLPLQLRQAGLEITVHDDVYLQTERDPLIFYQCGVKKLVVITSDTRFRKSFPHMAAVALGHTTVIAFSQNNYKSDVRGAAFIKALPEIEKTLRKYGRKNFIGVVGMNGTFRVCDESPLPQRKQCDLRDWESYEHVCRDAGVLALAPKH